MHQLTESIQHCDEAVSIQKRSVTDGQTDGRRDRIAIAVSRVSIAVLTRDENEIFQFTSKRDGTRK